MMAAASPPVASASAVLGIGVTTPIGYGVRPTQAAMASGLRNFQDSCFVVGDGTPARTSRLEDVDEAVERAERITLLTRLAIADLLANTSVVIPGSVRTYVGVAHDAPESDLRAISAGLAQGSRGLVKADAATLRTSGGGRIAFLSALGRAIRAFEQEDDELALIVSADTRCTSDAVDSLMRERRLLTSKDDGSIPGEAAIVALVAAPRSESARHARFFVGEPAFGDDPFDTLRQSPQATQGLSRAFRSLRERQRAGAVRPAAIVAFETGELFFTRAFTTAYLRNVELMPEPLRHELIAAFVGDTGAAAAGMALVRADWLMRREDADPQSILIYGHADDGRCAAALAVRAQQR